MSEQKILVVEDDLLVGTDLVEKLIRHGYTDSVLINKGTKAVDWIRENKPALLICDVDLGIGIDGVEVARLIREILFVPVIFITAYAHPNLIKIMKSFDSVLYLTKPIRLIELITNIELLLGKACPTTGGKTTEKKSALCSDSLFIPNGNTYKRLLINDICYFEADGNYVSVIMTKGKDLIATNLGTIEKQLDKKQFVRINRKHIINSNYINSVNGNVVLMCDKILPLGDTYKKDLMENIGILRTKFE